jgi:hypothetical protein
MLTVYEHELLAMCTNMASFSRAQKRISAAPRLFHSRLLQKVVRLKRPHCHYRACRWIARDAWRARKEQGPGGGGGSAMRRESSEAKESALMASLKVDGESDDMEVLEIPT